MVPPGTYENAEITGSALKKGKSSDDPVVEIYFLVDGEPLTAYLYTTPRAWEYTEQKLRACGFNITEHDYNLVSLNLDGDANPINGRTVRIVVKEEEYEGKIRSKVAFIGDFTGGEKMPDAEAVEFTKALRRRLMASQGSAKPAAVPARETKVQTLPRKTGSVPTTSSTEGPTDEAPW